MLLSGSLLFVMALAVPLSFLLSHWVMGLGWMDQPNGRSMHKRPMPLCGGIGVITGTALPLVFLLIFERGGGQNDEIMVLMTLGLLAGLTGLFDDLHDWSAKRKFGLIAILSLVAAVFLYPVTSFALDQGQMTLPFLLGVAGTALWFFVMTNGANFMDGSDGLIVTSAVAGTLALALLSLDDHNRLAALLALSLGVGLLGFLPLNLAPARLFLGDTGSLFIGFWLAGTALFYIHNGPPGALYGSVLVFMPWLSDVLLTMAWRLRQKQDLMQAHKDHLYQIMLGCGTSHSQVMLAMAVQIGLCSALAWLFRHSATSEALALVAIATLYLIVHWQARTVWSADCKSSA